MQATVIQVDLRNDVCNAHFDDEFPFLLQGRVDPERYAQTMCQATSYLRTSSTKLWIGLLMFLLFCIPASVAMPMTITFLGLWAISFEIIIIFVGFFFLIFALVSARRARTHMECFLREENRLYYNSLGVNLKYHYHYRHGYINIEILNMIPQQQQFHAQPIESFKAVSESSPLVYNPQQVPVTSFTYGQPVVIVQSDQQHYPYIQQGN